MRGSGKRGASLKVTGICWVDFNSNFLSHGFLSITTAFFPNLSPRLDSLVIALRNSGASLSPSFKIMLLSSLYWPKAFQWGVSLWDTALKSKWLNESLTHTLAAAKGASAEEAPILLSKQCVIPKRSSHVLAFQHIYEYKASWCSVKGHVKRTWASTV